VLQAADAYDTAWCGPSPLLAARRFVLCLPPANQAPRGHHERHPRDSTSLTSQNLYWRLRAACYHLVPGVVRFYDTNSLPPLVEDQGMTVVECNGEPGRVTVLARA
jgi:hypothetical protein